MIFRQLYDAQSSTYTYLLADEETKAAVLIDPVFEKHQRDAALVRELGVRLEHTLETHVHADHVTGAWLLRERLGSRIGLSAAAGAEGADLGLKEGDVVRVGRIALRVLATPGHTDGCLTYVVDDAKMAFTGDALLIRGAGRTDFQRGDAGLLFRSITEKILALPDETLLYPAHDYEGRTVTSVAEERAHNPRCGGDANQGDFVGYMTNLGLPHPKQFDVAVPANLRCGRPSEPAGPFEPAWGPASRTYAGILEIDPTWVAEHRADLTIVDVRERVEFEGELGHAEGALLVPLGELRAKLDTIPRERPVVLLCRSGRRSAQASTILEKAGFPRVANVAGGLIRWKALGLAVVGGSPD